MDNISCLILAGGQSKRFGENKALYVFDGKSLFERVLETALKVADDIIISVRNINNLDEFRCALIAILNKIYSGSDFAINCKSNVRYKKELVEIAVAIQNAQDIQLDNYIIDGNINRNCGKIKNDLKNKKIHADKDADKNNRHVNRHNNKKYLNFKIIADADDKNSRLAGPLKGIFSCFNYLKNDYVLLLECDAPFFNFDCANILINKIQNGEGGNYKNFDAVVPMWSDSTIEPLLACYNRKKTLSILSMLNSYALNLANYDDFIYNDAINIARFIGRVYYFYINDIIKENNRIKSEYFRNINDKDSLIGILKQLNCENTSGNTDKGESNGTVNSINVNIVNSVNLDEIKSESKTKDKNKNQYKYKDDCKDRGKYKYKDKYKKDTEHKKSIIAVKRNNFLILSGKLNRKKNLAEDIHNGKLAKPYGYLANQLYYLKLYSKNKKDINNSKNIGNNNNDNYRENIINNHIINNNIINDINNYDGNNNKNINENNNKNNADKIDKIYLKKLIFYLNKEKNFYLNKNLFFIAAKIQKAINFYKKL
ncbi:MAG: hypothetical protein EVJ46_00950 [Candidatus Acididesulfobacter guangdongensis]|uniref:MobA-like NTP transferase domain-containing protein n=1 Tax=Acididesulfobacter guangdongensis TaxID=2597225 RepID=A0A519BHV9_ACIG2|nr:MAG: hypothetical protein EVJ46_00950 [Candidatus Acididesulfobacter guangdongensis]